MWWLSLSSGNGDGPAGTGCSPSRLRSLLLALPLAGAIVGLTPLLAAASSGYADRMGGVEIAATSTQGTFVGTAAGDLPGAWSTVVDHQPLNGATPVAITGGSFSLATVLHYRPATIVGTFQGCAEAGSGCEVKQTGGFAGCVNQTYHVEGTLVDVGVLGGQDTGTGSFAGTLTHYRVSVFGSCVTYGASVSATATLTF